MKKSTQEFYMKISTVFVLVSFLFSGLSLNVALATEEIATPDLLPVVGCMNNTATNYNALATEDSDPTSCIFNTDEVEQLVQVESAIAPTVNLTATKIICDNEVYLPNWGAGGADITSTTASDFIATHGENCHGTPWTFEWAVNAPYVPDNNLSGGAGWTSFSGTTSVPAGTQIALREQMPAGYIPFTGQNTDQDVSAEFYCGSDVLNYDNLEYVNTEADHSYNCVAFNVATETNGDGGMCGDQDETNHEIVSDTTTMHGANPAVAVGTPDGSWATIPGATWIWTTDPVTSHVTGETQVFTKTFAVSGDSSDATLEVAADNSYSVSLNGGPAFCTHPGGDGFLATQSCNIPAGDLLANNTLTFTVTNNPEPSLNQDSPTDPYRNPAGLLYKLSFSDCGSDETPNQCNPEVNLLENGGFETPALSPNTWSIVTDSSVLKWLYAWVSPQTSGTEGLEIQNNVAGAPASGSQHAELDGDHPVKIWQDVATVPGQTYNLNFKYSGRPGVGAADNSILTKIEGTVLGATLADNSTAQSNTVWTPNTRTFVATDSSTKVEFYDNGTDTSLGGYLDDVSLNCSTEEYQCTEDTNSQTIVSSSATTMKDGSPVVEIPLPHHTAWTASIPDAVWVWGEYPTSDTQNDLTETFTQNFNVSGTPTGGSLMIAADNSYSVMLNGNPLCADNSDTNFSLAGQDTCAISADMLLNGNNLLTFTVKNIGMNGSTQDINPAGLMYKVVINNNQCLPPPPVDVCTNIQGNQASLPEGDYFASAGICLPIADMCSNIDGVQTQVPANYHTNDGACDPDPASITIVKKTVGGDGEFTFQISGQDTFIVPTIEGTGSHTVPVVATEGTPFSVNELAISGWDLTSVSCEYENNAVGQAIEGGELVVLDAGDNVTCTFTNTKELPPPPTTGSIKITKYECPADTHVVRSENGVGGTVPADCTPEDGATFGYVHGEQTDANGPYPELSTTLTAGGTTVDGMLVINDLPATGRYLVEETNSDNNKIADNEILGLYCTGDGDTSDHNDNQELTFVTAGETVNCVAYNKLPSAYITVIKHAIGGNGTFNFTDNQDEDSLSLTTEEDGWSLPGTFKVYPKVAGESYDVNEYSIPEGWDFTNASCVYDNEETGSNIENGESVFLEPGDEVTCTFTNTLTSTDKHPQSHIIGGGSSGGTAPQGQVLGAETDALCAFNIDTYMRKGYKNNREQVKVLQWLLNKYVGSNLGQDGNFGPLTEKGVKAFQAKYADEILKGAWGISSPTGIFFRSTLAKAKNLECPQTPVPIPVGLNNNYNWSKSTDVVPTPAAH